jgi:hypothetical protein
MKTRFISEHKVIGIWRSETQKNKGKVVSEYWVEVGRNHVGNKLLISQEEYERTNIGDTFQIFRVTENNEG